PDFWDHGCPNQGDNLYPIQGHGQSNGNVTYGTYGTYVASATSAIYALNDISAFYYI
ncbi:9434_t:CDS:1, partial [Racocetra persica]